MVYEVSMAVRNGYGNATSPNERVVLSPGYGGCQRAGAPMLVPRSIPTITDNVSWDIYA